MKPKKRRLLAKTRRLFIGGYNAVLVAANVANATAVAAVAAEERKRQRFASAVAAEEEPSRRIFGVLRLLVLTASLHLGLSLESPHRAPGMARCLLPRSPCRRMQLAMTPRLLMTRR